MMSGTVQNTEVAVMSLFLVSIGNSAVQYRP